MRKFEKTLSRVTVVSQIILVGGISANIDEIVPKQNGYYFLKIKSFCMEKSEEPMYKQSTKTYNDLWLDVHVNNGRLFPKLQVPGTTLNELVLKTLRFGFEYQLEISFKAKEYVNPTMTIKI